MLSEPHTGWYASLPQQLLMRAGFAGCDGSIGPFAYLCRGGRFDFTILFENYFLSLLPSAVFILVALIRLAQLWGAKPKTIPSSVVYLKLAACAVLGALNIIVLIKWIQIGEDGPTRSVSIAESSLAIAATVALTLLTHQEQRRSITPSTLITVYLLLSILCDAVRCRTLWLSGNADSVATYFSAVIAAKFFILCVESQNKRSILIENWEETYGRESTSGILSKSVLYWVVDLLVKGFKGYLTPGDMFALKSALRSKLLLTRMNKGWTSYRDSGKHALIKNLLFSCRFTILLGAIPRIFWSVCKIVEPFLLTRIITYVQFRGTEYADPEDTGFALVAAVFLYSILRPITFSFYDQCKIRIRLAIRGSLVSSVIHHSALLEPGLKDGSTALGLITTDVARIANHLDEIHEFWILPIEVGVAAWLLARQVGFGAFGPAATFFVSGVISSILAMFMSNAQKTWSESVRQRIGDTTTVLGSMKETKMLGLVESWRSAIVDLMDNQLEKSRLFRILIVLLNIAGMVPDRLAPSISFGIAILATNANLDLATVFTSLNIMGLVLGPLSTLTSTAPFLFSVLGAAERIQEFVEISEANQMLCAEASDSSGYEPENDMSTATGRPVFAAQGATISVKGKEEPILTDVNFSIRPETFTVVAGRVGTGKSVLLRAMLGQLRSSGTMVKRMSKVAYCAQTTWLMNATARENIIGQSEWDEELYNAVVAACALDVDFEELPNGDSALVGSKGLSLSGGQKQRISLARAMYSREDVVIVDDMLSGLDWATQRHVWEHVFSESGMLRKNRVTVILATHALHLIENSDSIILLGDSGPGQAVQGSFDELKATTKLQELISSSKRETEEEDTKDKAVSNGVTVQSAKSKTEEEQKTELLRKTGDLSLYKFYFDAVGWSRISMLLIGGLGFAAMQIIPDLWLKWWGEANSDPDRDVNTAFYYWIYTLLGVVAVISMTLIIWVTLIIVGPVGVRNLHGRILKTAMRAPLSFFVATDTGDLINRFTRDVEQVDIQMPINLFQGIIAFFIFISSMILIVYGSSLMVFLVPPMLLFVYFLQQFYLQTSRQLRFLDLNATAPLYNHFIETVDGASTIQAFGWESVFSERGLRLLDEAQKPKYTLSIIQVWLEVALSLFVAGVTVLLITVCVAFPATTSAGAIALAFTHVLDLGGILAMLISSWTQLETSLGSVERLRSFEEKTPQEKQPENPEILHENWPTDGRVELNSVTASYCKPDGSAFKALSNIDVTIQPGHKVGICGRTGSGKSSLLLTLFRLLELDSGSIVIDGVDIAEISSDVLRSRLICVPQEPMIFPGTLRSNLSPVNSPKEVPPEQLDEHLIDCLRKVELWESIHTQGGLDSAVADLGLSQGQKQLVCLARALARKETSRILVLDEAMSAVDQQTETLMVKVLETEFKGHTIISVVHRLNTVREFDTVLLLDRGVVVEAGEPGALLEKEGGRFRALWNGRSS